MRILVTGPANPVGVAIVKALAADGHQVRAFGVEPGSNPFAGLANVSVFPGWVEVGGSMEPVAAECQALVHAAAFDAPGEDKAAHAVRLEKGALYARYAAERELVQRFVAVFPADAGRAWSKSIAAAKANVQATRKLVPYTLLEAADAASAVRGVQAAIATIPADEATEAAKAADATL